MQLLVEKRKENAYINSKNPQLTRAEFYYANARELTTV